MQVQTELLQTLPEPQAELVFAVSGNGGWGAVIGTLVVLAALVAFAATALWWRRRRRRV